MPKVKSLDKTSEKWARVTPQRAQDYADGVQNPRIPWAQATRDAAANYKAGVTAAANAGRFEKGVAKAGDSAYTKGATTKGPQRFSEGVALGQPDYEEGFAPYRQVIEQTTLPPRRPAGDPTNIQRVAAMATALRQKKVGS